MNAPKTHATWSLVCAIATLFLFPWGPVRTNGDILGRQRAPTDLAARPVSTVVRHRDDGSCLWDRPPCSHVAVRPRLACSRGPGKVLVLTELVPRTGMADWRIHFRSAAGTSGRPTRPFTSTSKCSTIGSGGTRRWAMSAPRSSNESTLKRQGQQLDEVSTGLGEAQITIELAKGGAGC